MKKAKANKTIKKPFYCKECGKCITDQEAYDNLKIVNNTGWTHNVFCIKKGYVVYGL